MKENLRIADLIAAYLQGRLSEQDEKELKDWLRQKPENRVFFKKIINEQSLESALASLQSFDSAKALEKIKRFPQLPHTHKSYIFRWPRIAAAASIVAILTTGSYFLFRHQPPKNQFTENYHNDIKPGTNGAILTLASGKKIVLEEVKAGKVARQNGSQINKAGDSLLVYQPMSASKEVSYNTLETPKGRQVQLVLPDGSKVWLNAASTLKYPTTFTGKQRLVELTGEADFVVVPNSRMPFRVKSNGQLTEDIGTEFNINAYADEPSQRTTLLEGAIKVNGNVLKPGQQAILSESHISVTNANSDEAIAWKNGDFDFDHASITTVMRQLTRWYDIDVNYEGIVSQEGFNAIISRHKNISAVLNLLEKTKGVHFKIEGRRVTVMQ